MYRILARNRNDIIRERDEFDSRAKANREAFQRYEQDYRKAVREFEQGVAEEVKQVLNNDSLDITVNQGWNDDLRIRIANDRGKLFDKNQALTWEYSLGIDKGGNVTKESSSWSGLNATTAESIKDLRNTVNLLEQIMQTDWTPILRKTYPKFQEFSKGLPYPDMQNMDRPDYETELLMSDLEYCNGDSTKALHIPGNTGWASQDCWLFIEHLTPKFVTYINITQSEVAQYGGIREAHAANQNYTDKTRVDKLAGMIKNYNVEEV